MNAFPTDGERPSGSPIPSLAQIVETLAEAGFITDGQRARDRAALGFPPWLVLEELTPYEILRALHAATGVSVLGFDIDPASLDRDTCDLVGPEKLLEMRWLPLRDGRVAIANPFAPAPDGVLEGRPLTLVWGPSVDALLDREFPGRVAAIRNRRRLGRFLLDAGAVTEAQLAEALAEQGQNGGRLGEVLIAHDLVEPEAMTRALAGRAGIDTVPEGAVPLPLLPRAIAHELRVVAIRPVQRLGTLKEVATPQRATVAVADPSDEVIAQLRDHLDVPIDVQVTDDETLDALLASVYAQDDLTDAVEGLRREVPELSAYRTGLSRQQKLIVAAGLAFMIVGLAVDAWALAILVCAAASVCYVLYTVYRLHCAWKGWRVGSTINPERAELDSLDGRDLPSYTVLLPVFREKPTTIRTLLRSLSNLEYPKQKLHGLLLLEADDEQTLASLAEVEAASPGIRPRWLKTLLIPPGEPRTKPKAMIYGLYYATGDLLTIFDAEDQPEPDQLLKAAWAFQRAGSRVACIQAKLSYYNSRQNLLTRWFTLEYAAWFDLFLPGLHSMAAPIPLGGTSNHFRLSVLRRVLSWDPYNVTEDADLGLRFTRAGYRTQMLESTTFEEANSNTKNWIRQRSRWIKGYIQTFLVHTRNPVQLVRELGVVNTGHFLATVGGLIFTVVISPVFWGLLVLWLLFQPGWIPALFPGPIYYLAMANLAFGNFFFVLLALIGAVGRGQDDLSPYTLLFPVYWLMMSVAAYMALYELIRRPHYWQKTEHGLHVSDAASLEEDITGTPAKAA